MSINMATRHPNDQRRFVVTQHYISPMSINRPFQQVYGPVLNYDAALDAAEQLEALTIEHQNEYIYMVEPMQPSPVQAELPVGTKVLFNGYSTIDPNTPHPAKGITGIIDKWWGANKSGFEGSVLITVWDYLTHYAEAMEQTKYEALMVALEQGMLIPHDGMLLVAHEASRSEIDIN